MTDENPDNPAQKKRVAKLLRATVASAYLPFIAAEAGVTVAQAKGMLNTLADEYDAGTARVRDSAERVQAVKKTTAAEAKTGGMKVVLNTDGASRGNPGLAGLGVYMSKEDGTPIGGFKKFIGEATNNVAEYRALILGLDEAANAGARQVEVRADSELMIKQLTGVYKIKNADMQTLAQIVREKEKRFARVTYKHVPRAQNSVADKLANEAIDERVP